MGGGTYPTIVRALLGIPFQKASSHPDDRSSFAGYPIPESFVPSRLPFELCWVSHFRKLRSIPKRDGIWLEHTPRHFRSVSLGHPINRRATFTLTLPFAGLAYTLSPGGLEGGVTLVDTAECCRRGSVVDEREGKGGDKEGSGVGGLNGWRLNGWRLNGGRIEWLED